jgi:hypothetical protein
MDLGVMERARGRDCPLNGKFASETRILLLVFTRALGMGTLAEFRKHKEGYY